MNDTPKIQNIEDRNEEISAYMRENFPECGYILIAYEPETYFVHSFTNIKDEGGRLQVLRSYSAQQFLAQEDA